MVFMGSWFLFYILFPAWYLPISNQGRFLIFTLFLICFSFNGWLLKKWVSPRWDGEVFSLKWGKFRDFFKQNRGLLFLLAFSALLRLYPMTLPITSLGDEHYHSYVSVPLINFLERNLPFPLPLFTWALLLAAILTCMLGKRKVEAGREGRKLVKRGNKFMVAIGLSLGYLYFYGLIRSGLLEQLGPTEHLFRFPPLGKGISFIFYSLFGVSEFTARLPQLLFSLLAGIYIYRLVKLFRSPATALLAASILLFLPIFFHFGSSAYLASGVIFFVISSSFYFLRYLQRDRFSDLILSSYLLSLGFLYKRVLLIMLFVFLAYLLIYEMKGWKNKAGQKLKLYAQVGWLTLVPIIPWLIIGYRYVERNWHPLFSHLTSWSTATAVLRQIPQAASYPFFILFLVGLAYSLWRKRDRLTIFLLIWISLYYLFITLDTHYFDIRLNLPLYPALVIIVAQLMGEPLSQLKNRKVFSSLCFLFAGYLAIASTLVNFSPLRPEYTVLTNIKVGYLPYDQVFLYVKEHLPRGSRILATTGTEPSHFYLSLLGIQDEFVWYRENWVGSREEQTLDNLYDFCRENNFSYVVFPRGHWAEPWVRTELIEKLAREEDVRFRLIKTFRLGQNEIIMCRVMVQ